MMWKLYWKDYYFETGWHVGLRKFYTEIFNVKTDLPIESRYDFESLQEAQDYLRKYGYSNANRFLTEEVPSA